MKSKMKRILVLSLLFMSSAFSAHKALADSVAEAYKVFNVKGADGSSGTYQINLMTSGSVQLLLLEGDKKYLQAPGIGISEDGNLRDANGNGKLVNPTRNQTVGSIYNQGFLLIVTPYDLYITNLDSVFTDPTGFLALSARRAY